MLEIIVKTFLISWRTQTVLQWNEFNYKTEYIYRLRLITVGFLFLISLGVQKMKIPFI